MSERPPLIRLDWAKAAEGYDLIEIPPDPPEGSQLLARESPEWRLQSRGALRYFYVYGLIARVYLDLANVEPTLQGALEFTNLWGPLNRESSGKEEHMQSAEGVLNLRANIVKILELIDKEDFRSIQKHIPLKGIGHYAIGMSLWPNENIPTLYFETENLRSFIWAELMQSVSARVFARQCGFCGAFFQIGTKTGKNSHAQFCSSNCRVADHRARKKAKTKHRK